MISEANLDDAREMIEAFYSVNVRSFDLAETTGDGSPVSYRRGLNLIPLTRTLLPQILPAAVDARHNLILRPRPSFPDVLCQLDDLDQPKFSAVRSRAFIALETSPGNFQAWIAIARGDMTLVKRLIRGAGADVQATGAVRLAGTLNCKDRYAPDFPVVRIIHLELGLKLGPTDFDDLLVPAPVEMPRPAIRRRFMSFGSQSRGWPDYQRILHGAPSRSDGMPDRSRADYLFAKWSLERRNQPGEVVLKLLEVSAKAAEEWKRGNREYARRTVEQAMNAK